MLTSLLTVLDHVWIMSRSYFFTSSAFFYSFSSPLSPPQVRIFNFSYGQPHIYLLVGHSARSFNCAWSPLCEGMLATSSDDQVSRCCCGRSSSSTSSSSPHPPCDCCCLSVSAAVTHPHPYAIVVVYQSLLLWQVDVDVEPSTKSSQPAEVKPVRVFIGHRVSCPSDYSIDFLNIFELRNFFP